MKIGHGRRGGGHRGHAHRSASSPLPGARLLRRLPRTCQRHRVPARRRHGRARTAPAWRSQHRRRGRLVLADVLAWAVEEKPAASMELATLTGAILVALGPGPRGSSATTSARERVARLGRGAGEATWRMPLSAGDGGLIRSARGRTEEHRRPLRGAINAALFLQRLRRREARAHLDIAGPASSTRSAATTRGAEPAPACGCWRNGYRRREQRCSARAAAAKNADATARGSAGTSDWPAPPAQLELSVRAGRRRSRCGRRSGPAR